MKAGAVEFPDQPFRERHLLGAIAQAIERDRRRAGAKERDGRSCWTRYELLTPREQEVMELVVKGLLNKQIAAELENGRNQRLRFSAARMMKK